MVSLYLLVDNLLPLNFHLCDMLKAEFDLHVARCILSFFVPFLFLSYLSFMMCLLIGIIVLGAAKNKQPKKRHQRVEDKTELQQKADDKTGLTKSRW